MRMIYCSRRGIEERHEGTLFLFDVHDGHLVFQSVLMANSQVRTGNEDALQSIC